MIVMKFGGTSVESAAAMARVASIVESHSGDRAVVVVSAMGKTTNRLIAMAETAARGEREEALEQVHWLRDFHLRETPTGVHEFVEAHFRELEELAISLSVLRELTPRTIDLVSSFGERLSSLAFTQVLRDRGHRVHHVDSRDVIVTDSRHTMAAPNFTTTYRRLDDRVKPLAQRGLVVMGGFIASTEAGVTSTLGRGGSDYTAAIVGVGIDAEEIQIWTDVDGMLTADPRVLPGGLRIRVCSFDEASEMAFFGAKVLHPSTVLPAVEKNIPVRIVNSRNPGGEGTKIVAASPDSRSVAKSIACKPNVTIVDVTSTRMLNAYGFLRRIFDVFERHETSVDMLATSEVSVSLTIDNPAKLDTIVHELREFASVSFERDQAIVCLVGENIRKTPGVAGRVFKAIESVNIRMISQGASRLNIGFVVANDELTETVRLLHEEFFGEVDDDLFAPGM